MRTFTFNNFDEAYPELIAALLNEGKDVSPRGMLTKEIAPVAITINNPNEKVISNSARKLNYGFMVGELLWILRGSNNLGHIAHYNKQWRSFSDDQETLNGAYGQRIFNWDASYDIIFGEKIDDEGNTHPDIDVQHIIIDQFEMAYEQLKADAFSRQATIVLFNPKQDCRETRDKPCTNLIRFMVREGKLNMTVFMRSNDIILGFPYDIFNFTILQEIMAGRLGVEIGKYTHIADSFHIYEHHFDMANEIIKQKGDNLYANNIVTDARIDNKDYSDILKLVFDVESVTRNMGSIIDLEIVTKELDKIRNDYWRSLAAVVAVYNFRKFGRNQDELEILKGYITNEFASLDTIKNWKTLKK